MYLSRLILNPQSPQVQKDVAMRYQLHRTIMRAFPETLPDDERVLFRLEIDAGTGVPVLTIQSHYEPDWTWAIQRRHYLLASIDPDIVNPDVKQFDLEFAQGQTFYFRLRANPTVKRDGKRHGLYREEEQLAWLRRKAEAGGFHVIGVRTSDDKMVHGRVKRPEKTHQMRFVSVQFDGVLRVTDPAKLRDSVARGIGSGKGLGFGLLSLARA